MTNPVAKIGDLGQIKRLKKELDRRVQEQSDKVAAELAEERVREQCKELFKTAVGAIHPLRAPERKRLEPSLPPPIPTQRQLDELAVVREALSDEWDASSLLNTDEALSFRRPGVGVDVLRKLRQGVWSVQAHLDLHRLRTDEARNALAAFIRESHKLGMRCVRVVHGKGLGSPGKVPVLRPKVQSWLIQKNQVMAFVQAGIAQGGAGAIVVLLQAGSHRASPSAGNVNSPRST